MKRRALLQLVLTLTLVFGAGDGLADVFEISATALADSATPITRNADRAEEPVPMTDRIPWLIYVVLTSSTVALAWILFSLARGRIRNGPRNDDKQA
jgi:hypothetical protein